MQIKIKEDNSGRIDALIAKELELPRNQIQKLIKTDKILVNKKTINAHYKPLMGDVISIDLKKEKVKPQNFKLDIIAETDNYYIINKPAGLIVHPIDEDDQQTSVVSLILKHNPDLVKIGEDPIRPGIVHRLDKNVSGLIIIAKTQKFYKHIKKQFLNRKVDKTYLGLVYGQISKDEGTIDFPILRSEQNKTIMAAQAKGSEEGREAITKFSILKKYLKYTFLEIKIITGRSHQIRVHFKALAHPIVNDHKYKIKTYPITEKLEQIFLHAHSLKFTDVDRRKKTFTALLPEQLDLFLEGLR